MARFDDLIAGGLKELIEANPGLDLVAADVEPPRLSVVIQGHRPGVAILDLQTLNRLSEIRELATRHPATRLILLANEPSTAESMQALAFGASALLGRHTQARDVLSAIHLASRGLQVLPRSSSNESPGRDIANLLTPREGDVLPLLREGRSNAQVAVELGMGIETVRTHARNIYRKLGVSSRQQLAAAPPLRKWNDLGPPLPMPRQRPTLRGRPRRGAGLPRR